MVVVSTTAGAAGCSGSDWPGVASTSVSSVQPRILGRRARQACNCDDNSVISCSGGSGTGSLTRAGFSVRDYISHDPPAQLEDVDAY